MLDSLVGTDQVEQLIKQTYDSTSPYSLVMEELAYAVAPSEEFHEAFKRVYPESEYPGKLLKINILDTPGLTQVGEEKVKISYLLNDIRLIYEGNVNNREQIERQSCSWLFIFIYPVV